ncbi:MAG: DJ-1/PfpI family protein [Treponemataceae bacterium]|nr:MAG: DJ-1/PfpI family protein [Treponemataceae bacterium]
MKAIILLADGFEEIEAVTPADYLRRAGVEVITAACSSKPEAEGSHGIRIIADALVKDISLAPDAIVCPGGMPGASNIAKCKDAVDLILKTRDAGKITAALCASPIVVFAKLGLLAGKTFTCFPGMEASTEKFAGSDAAALMRGSSKTMNAVEIDGNVITGQGPGAAEEFSLALISALLGKAAAEKVQKESWLRTPR